MHFAELGQIVSRECERARSCDGGLFEQLYRNDEGDGHSQVD
jgi:hypothetical protein